MNISENKLYDNAQFDIIYDGPALELNEMEVKELAPALIALSDLIEEANKIFNGNKAKVVVNVRGTFKTGSFLTEISVHPKPTTAALNLLATLGFIGGGSKGLLYIIKWMRRRKISSIVPTENGNFKIEIDDENLEVSPEAISLLENYKIRQCLERIITKPLQREGIDWFAVKTDKEEIFVINKKESNYFECPPIEDLEIEDKIYNSNLQIVTLAFQEGNKWKVTDGVNPFFATVEDQIYLRKINNNEISFSKGDILEAKVRKHVWLDSDSNMKADYTILEVLSHKSAAKQLRLF